jgi:crotonobetainyl-CoA:carnitine CoA-transferase CaiB-like acyl-CoA transferase
MTLLTGLRVLTVDQYGAGPYAGLHLADMGADVIKIEPPAGGDYGRSVPPFTADTGDDSLFFQAFNRNKRSVALDLAHPHGADTFRRLAAHADAVLTNLRGDAARRLGLGYALLCDVNPRIVCAFLTGFGREGPRSNDAGFDYMLQAESGIMSLAGEPGGPPVKAGVSIIDFAAGISSAMSLLAGVLSARDKGRGGDVDVSLQDTAASLLNYVATWQLTRGYETPRLAQSAHPSLVPSQLFDCLDRPIMVMVNKEAFWPRLAAAVGHPEWRDAPDRADFSHRLRNRQVVTSDLQDVFATGTAAHWLERLAAHGVPSAPVRTVAEAFCAPGYADRTVSFPHEEFGEVRSPGPLVSAGPGVVPRRGPSLGQHTEEVLASVAGMSVTEISDLKSAGVIRTKG